MKVILTKRQVEVLKEANNKLDVTVNPSDPNFKQKIDTAMSNNGLIDDINIPVSGVNSTQTSTSSDPSQQVHAEIEPKNGTNLPANVLNKALKQTERGGMSSLQIDTGDSDNNVRSENFVRYSKKELNEILFR